MIQLYPKGAADFTVNGIELHPGEADVTWQIGGRYDCSVTIPREACEGITFDYGQILRISVPEEHVNAISLGTVSYYETNTSTPLYSQIPKSVKVSYNNWQAQRSYMAGDKVTYDGKNWRCVTGHGGLSVPPPNGGLWTQIAGTRMDSGKTIATLASGTSVMKVRDFNSTYIEAATLTGLQGYIKTEDVDATGESESRTIPAFDIAEQLFTISKIDKETDAHNIRLEGEHISYQLGRTILDECSVVGVNPATALRFIAGAMQETYPGGLYTNITEGEIEADWSWSNAQAAILDPQKGLLKAVEARVIRDNRDIYIVPNPEGDAAYEIRYGVNMKTVKWTGDVSGIVTRVYPIAQREDGSRLTLPDKYIDSPLPVPYIRPEVLDTKLKIGEKIENSDGTEVTLTEDDVLDRMEEMARNRFDVDHCDRAEVTLDLDWIHMPDTEEYSQYMDLRNAAPAAWVRVTNGPMGVDTVIQMTGYTFDPILKRYKKATFGDKAQRPSVAGYDIKTGAVTNRALGAGAVRGENIAAGAITAREIEANSITAEQIASKVITAALIAAGAIRAESIDTNDLTAIQATLQIASIANAQIQVADIGYAQIKDANVENLIARDALTDRYYIDKLQVRNLQSVYATVGELVVKAADNNYYKLTVNSSGEIVTTQVTPTSAEITAGVTSDGHAAIIETDLTVQDLAASNVKAINALIDKLTAARINVDELFARTAFINKLNTTDIESTANLTIKTGGTFTVQSGNFEIDSSGNVTVTGKINAEAGGTIAGWDINAASLTGNKTGIAKTTNDSDIAFWAGSATAGSANFRVTQGGDVYLRSLKVLNEQGTETTVDLRSYPLWKLSYATVKSITVDSGSGDVTIVTTAGTYSFNRGSGGSITLSGAWTDNWTRYTVTATQGGTVVGTISSGAVNADKTNAEIKAALEASASHLTVLSIEADGETLVTRIIDASGVYTQGTTAGWNSGYDTARGYVTMPSAGTGTSFTVGVPKADRSGAENRTFTITKGTPSASGGYASVSYNNSAVCRISLSDWWTGGVNSVTVSAGGWQNGANRVSASNGKYVDVTLPSFSTSGGTSFSSHKTTVYFTTASVSGNLASKEVDATSEYNSGWTGSYNAVTLSATGTKSLTYNESVTVYPKAKSSASATAANITSISYKITAPADRYQTGYNAGYTQGNLDGVASVTITKVEQQGAITYSGGNYSVPAKATASNSKTGSGTITFSGSAAYNAGWNAALAACGIPSGGTVTVGGSYYANLYVMNQSGPSRVGYGIVNYNSRNTVQTK